MLVILMTSAPVNEPAEPGEPAERAGPGEDARGVAEPEPALLPALPALPSVGVVMPILDEERHLQEAVDAVLGQDYAGPVQLVLALGPSHDRTDEIARSITEREPRVRSVANPSGRTPEALNAALVALPHARRRLRLDDRDRCAVMARRFTDQHCLLLDDGTALEFGSSGELPSGARILGIDGAIHEMSEVLA